MTDDPNDLATAAVALVLHEHGVACPTCGGRGEKMYSSTSTWRGGMGGSMCTSAVCDSCWGTGRTDVTGVDRRAALANTRKMKEEEVREYLAQRLGANLRGLVPVLDDLADYCDKQSRRRKLPPGTHPFWHSMNWETLAGCIRGLKGDNE